MTTPLKVAVVGVGIGKSHLEAYAKLPREFEVVAVCDLDFEKATDRKSTRLNSSHG